MNQWRALLSRTCACIALAACGDDDGTPRVDAGPGGGRDGGGNTDAGPGDPDGGADAGPPGDAGPLPEDLTLHPTPLVADATDRFLGVTIAADGSIYAVGFQQDDLVAGTDTSIVVAKFDSTGTLVPAFGDMGVAVHNVVEGGSAESARGIAVQSSGRVVVAGHAEHDPTAAGVFANDRDIFFLGIDPATGELDETFGEGGITRVDVNTGVEGMNMMGTPIIVAADESWGLDLDGDDRLVAHGLTRAPGARTDTDWVTIRLTADGDPDMSFSGDGIFTLDIDMASGNARAATVLPDDTILAAGYSATLSSDMITSPVIYKVGPTGMLEPGFGVGGIFHRVVLPTLTEAYAAVPHMTGFVTAGYGRAAMEESIDIVSLRLDGAGMLDESWGEDGVVRIDVGGFADRGRYVLALPDGRVMLIGGGQTADGVTDALLAVRTATGEPDTTFAPTTGYRLSDLGGNNDFFWHADISADGTTVAIVGYKAFTMQTATDNDDAVLAIWHAD
jgi:uncharacterized delta-60 repeat protein